MSDNDDVSAAAEAFVRAILANVQVAIADCDDSGNEMYSEADLSIVVESAVAGQLIVKSISLRDEISKFAEMQDTPISTAKRLRAVGEHALKIAESLEWKGSLPMSEMIQRVARALAQLEGHENLPTLQSAYEQRARVAIEAMREPTDDMLDDGEWNAEHGVGPTWRSMISAALEEQHQ